MAPGVAELALESIAERAPVLHAEAVVVGDAVVQQLEHTVEPGVRLGGRQAAKPIREVRGIVRRVGPGVHQQLVIPMIAGIRGNQHVLLAERLLNFEAPFQVRRRVNLARCGEEIRRAETGNLVGQLSKRGPVTKAGFEGVVLGECGTRRRRANGLAKDGRREFIGEIRKDVLGQSARRKIGEEADAGTDHHAVCTPRTPYEAHSRQEIGSLHGGIGVGKARFHRGIIGHVHA